MTTALAPRHSAPATDLSNAPIRPQRFTRLTQVELRKMLNTRSGFWIVAATLGVVVIAAAWMIIDKTAPEWGQFGQILQVGSILLPVIGLMGMTSEWTQRTALTTFTQSPRRGRVLAAKFFASLLLCAAVFVVMVGILAAAVAVAGAVSGDPVSFAGFWTLLRGVAIIIVAQIIMAMGFGALVGHTAFAIVLFFVSQTIIPIVTFQVFGENADWVNVFSAYDRLASNDPWANLGQTVVSLLIWVVLPFVVGIVRSMRREVK